MPSVTVEKKEFLSAVKAALPHADSDPELGVYHRVIFRLADDGTLHVTAANPISCGLSIVQIDTDGELGEFALTPPDCKAILALFRVPKDAIDGQDLIQIQWQGTEVTMSDVSGLLGGVSATWDITPPDPSGSQVKTVEEILATLLSDSHIPAIAHLAMNSASIASFTPACRAYKSPMVLTHAGHRGSNFLVSIGDAFLGMVTGGDSSDPEHACFPNLPQWRTNLGGLA